MHAGRAATRGIALHDYDVRLRSLRTLAPTQTWKEVCTVLGVLPRDIAAVLESGAGDAQRDMGSRRHRKARQLIGMSDRPLRGGRRSPGECLEAVASAVFID